MTSSTRPSIFRPEVLAGKTAFVAGGSSGINLAIARAYAAAGAAVAITSRKREKVEAAVASIEASGGRAWGAPADVRDYARMQEVLAEAERTLGALDIIVSGAAGNFISPALGMSANAFKTVVDIDLLGTFNGASR